MKKTHKEYLHCIVTRRDGTQFTNCLKLSEVTIISKLAQENKKLSIELMSVPIKEYDLIFGL